jgi:hypothetical protein
MAVSMKKWLAMTDVERVAFVQAGKITAQPVMGIRSDAKVNEDDGDSGFVQFRAYSRSILFGYGDTEQDAIRHAYKNLSVYMGKFPSE